jgi:hypothetical protein
MMLPAVEKLAIIATVFGAMLFVRGLIPGLLGALMEGLRNCRDHPSPSRGPIHNIQTDMRLYGDIRMVICGAIMMILGFGGAAFSPKLPMNRALPVLCS